jgi:hypothetical protein
MKARSTLLEFAVLPVVHAESRSTRQSEKNIAL